MLSGLGVRDMSAVLKLVTQKQFSEQVDVDLESSSRNGHSLQTPLSYLSPWQPAVLRHVTERFSVKGQTVLDLTCAAGATGVECASQGRHFIGCTNEYALAKLARARLNPADIAEVVLRLQFINFKRPVDIRGFQEPFSNFFDIDTYRELLSLKLALRGSQDRVGHFIQFVVASIIHGHTVGHLSAYTSPQAAITPGAQATLNGKRGEVPSYRAVGARVIKKAAMLLRDGIPSGLQDDSIERSIYCAEPNNIIDVGTGKVDLALLCPEQPGAVQQGLRSWLRSWWLGVDLPEQRPEIASIPAWQEHISEVLLENGLVPSCFAALSVDVVQSHVFTDLSKHKVFLLCPELRLLKFTHLSFGLLFQLVCEWHEQVSLPDAKLSCSRTDLNTCEHARLVVGKFTQLL